jgi:hypothetical protein
MRFSMIGFAVAAVIGLFMGAIGLYGVLSYVTAQRTREIGVRMALGATPSSVRVGVLRRGIAVSAAGIGDRPRCCLLAASDGDAHALRHHTDGPAHDARGDGGAAECGRGCHVAASPSGRPT